MSDRLPDPTTTPVGPGFASAELDDAVPTQSHDLKNASTAVVISGSQYFNIKISYNEMLHGEEDTYNIQTFLRGRKGAFRPIEVVLPQYTQPRNGFINTSGADVPADQVGDVLQVTNWDSIGQTWMQSGDIIQLSTSSSKVYEVQEASYVVGGVNNGTLTLTLNTPLVVPTAVSDSLVVNNVTFKTRMRNSNLPFKLTSNGTYQGFTLQLRESTL